VTVTVKAPLTDGLQDKVEVPEAVMLLGVRVHVSPVAGLIVEVRLVSPVNPLTAVTVIVEVPGVPTSVRTLVGLAVIVKPWSWKVTVAEWSRAPLEPVTVTA
jgi:hypothetical protein